MAPIIIYFTKKTLFSFKKKILALKNERNITF